MVLAVFASRKSLVYQLLGGLLGCRRGRQPKADLIDVDCRRRATEIRHWRRTARAFRLAHEADAALG